MGTCIGAGCLMLGSAIFAQNPPNPTTPQHPIDTRPEGQQQNCTFSVSRGSGQTTGNSTCPPAGGASAAQKFPYPGDTTPSPVTPTPAADAPQPAGSTQQPSAAQRFPFPGEDSKSATPASPLQDAGSSGNSSRPPDSSSSSSSSSSSGADNNFGDTPGDDTPDNLPAPKRARKGPAPRPEKTTDEREEEDLKVAAFYQNDGNYRAAYLRAKDAVTLDDNDPQAHFALAEAARKLGKLDEAEQNYKRCLALDPVPKLKKDSEKALKEMSGS